jgi:hypothetical protein
MGYIKIHIKIRISSPTCDRAWIPPNPRDTCPACIPHVFRMYPACILITSEDTCISHVSRMYPACLLHIRYISLWMHLSYMYLIMYLGCVSRMYLDHPVADTCISHVSLMYLASQIRTSSWRVQDTCIVILYLGVSWCIIRCIVMKSPRYTYPDVSWHVSSVAPRKRPRYMYLNVSHVYPKMYLGLVWYTCVKCTCNMSRYMYSLGM